MIEIWMEAMEMLRLDAPMLVVIFLITGGAVLAVFVTVTVADVITKIWNKIKEKLL